MILREKDLTNLSSFLQKKVITEDREDVIRSIIKIPSDMFFDVFPFIIVFNRGMHIRNIGMALMRLMPRLIGRRINHEFVVMKPSIRFRWEDVKDFYLENSKDIL